jgi:DNA replication licensing factor MCM3
LTDRIATAVDDFDHLSKTGDNAAIRPRVSISMAELRSDRELAQGMQRDPLRNLRALETAVHALATEERPGYDKGNDTQIKVSISGPIGASASSPRQLSSNSLRSLVCVEGVATKVSTIKPKVVQSVHYCPTTKQHQSRDYVDATDPQLGLKPLDQSGNEIPDRVINITSSVYPTKDGDGNALETEFGLSTYKDHQTITLQEMPEKAPMGQLPRSIELVLDHDLVDKIKPGDRVMVVGVYRALATSSQGQQTSSGLFRTVVLVNNVQILGRDVSHLNFSPQDIRMIRSLSKRNDILSVLGRSIAPSIHGHAVIKKALALQLLSGVEKNLENGTHLRGDINILMVGDPSTAKSQLLRSAMMIAPLAVSTTGKGSSGVGLTAAVTSDPDTRERRLEAGAMVLADRGLVCVDEFDKMGENDRVAIHEAMEQQTVTIAKAGIHASLNARCSVLAAANPVYGQYDKRRRIQENIGLPDSLLSRFDLLFVVLDQIDPEIDRRIATHVIRGHGYRNDAGQAGHDSDYDDSDDEEDMDETTKVHSVWQRNRHDDDHSEVLQHEFLRKYLHFSKTRMQPILTESAREYIANRYVEMRARQDERTLPITARSLETVIRLATAHAKARLSEIVEAEPDCQIAMDILGFALYHELTSPADEKEKAIVTDDDDDAEKVADDGESEDDGDEEERASKRAKLQHANNSMDMLKARIVEAIAENDGELNMNEIPDALGENADNLQVAVDALSDEGRIMMADGVLYQLD